MGDFDVHMCLCCKETITGLEAYVLHKKHSCPALDKEKKPQQAAKLTDNDQSANITLVENTQGKEKKHGVNIWQVTRSTNRKQQILSTSKASFRLLKQDEKQSAHVTHTELQHQHSDTEPEDAAISGNDQDMDYSEESDISNYSSDGRTEHKKPKSRKKSASFRKGTTAKKMRRQLSASDVASEASNDCMSSDEQGDGAMNITEVWSVIKEVLDNIEFDHKQGMWVLQADRDAASMRETACPACDCRLANWTAFSEHLNSKTHQEAMKKAEGKHDNEFEFQCFKLLAYKYQCHICYHFEAESVKKFTKHMTSVSHINTSKMMGKEPICSACTVTVTWNSRLVKHMGCRKHRRRTEGVGKLCIFKGVANKEIPCPDCGTRVQEYKLKQHMCKDEDKSLKMDVESSHSAGSSGEQTVNEVHPTGSKSKTTFITDKVYACDICGKRFSQERYKEIHMMDHTYPLTEYSLRRATGEKYPEIPKRYHELLDSIKLSPQKVAQCPDCNVKLKGYQVNICHIRKHVGSKPFTCPLCSKNFFDSNALRRHLLKHISAEHFACDQCEYTCSLGYKMEQHKNNMHPTERHLCDTCGKAFGHVSGLKAHQLQVHGEKIYKCDHAGCKAACSTHSQLLAHQRTHITSRSYLCDACGFAATTPKYLQRHKKRCHEEPQHPCLHCPYVASTPDHLKRHQLIHRGIKPYHCPYCTYRCNEFSNLMKHIQKIANHGFIYPCKHCEYGTNCAQEIRLHLLETHKVTDNITGKHLQMYLGIYIDEPDAPHPQKSVASKRQKRYKCATYQEATSSEEQDAKTVCIYISQDRNADRTSDDEAEAQEGEAAVYTILNSQEGEMNSGNQIVVSYEDGMSDPIIVYSEVGISVDDPVGDLQGVN